MASPFTCRTVRTRHICQVNGVQQLQALRDFQVISQRQGGGSCSTPKRLQGFWRHRAAAPPSITKFHTKPQMSFAIEQPALCPRPGARWRCLWLRARQAWKKGKFWQHGREGVCFSRDPRSLPGTLYGLPSPTCIDSGAQSQEEVLSPAKCGPPT